MRDLTDSSKEADIKVTEHPKTSIQGIRAMQGVEDKSEQDLHFADHNRIKASQFTQGTKKALEDKELTDSNAILSDNTGRKPEAVAQIVAENQGLPDGNGGYQKFSKVIPGQYNKQGNGIDLIGVKADGSPTIIEVKKREIPQRDGIGNDEIKNLNEETKKIMENIELERHNNPVLAGQFAQRERDIANPELAKRRVEADPELSPDQMSDLWVRDRWITLVKNDSALLTKAGIKQEYVDLDKLVSNPYSDEWKQILNSRHTVIVSQHKDDVSTTLYRQAIFRKGFSVSVIDLGS